MPNSWNAWGASFGNAWSESWGVAPVVWKRPGPSAGKRKKYHQPERYYLPPGWEKRKPSIEQVRELYLEAREEIPPIQQRGLLPVAHRTKGRSVTRLPPARLVDFNALRADLEAVAAIATALQEIRARREQQAIAEQRKAKIRRQETELVIALMLGIDTRALARRQAREFVTTLLLQ